MTRQEAWLPLEKLHKCRALLSQFFRLQSLTGLLNFCCSVVVLGRAFLRHLIDLTMGQLRPHHQIRLCKEAKLDIRMWLQFFSRFEW